MRLVNYRYGDIVIRHSVVRLLGHDEVSKKELHEFLQNERPLKYDKVVAAVSADRCCLYIENFRSKKIAINSEHFLITLIAVFPHNFVARNYLAPSYMQHLAGMRDILLRNIAKSIPPFEGAKYVIDYIIEHRMLTESAVNIYILIYNLLICHTGYFLILDDTDSIDGTLMRGFLGAMEKHA